MHRSKLLLCLPAAALLWALAGCSGGDPNATVKAEGPPPPGAGTMAAPKAAPAAGGQPASGTSQSVPHTAQ